MRDCNKIIIGGEIKELKQQIFSYLEKYYDITMENQSWYDEEWVEWVQVYLGDKEILSFYWNTNDDSFLIDLIEALFNEIT